MRRFVTHGGYVAEALDQAARSAGTSLAEASAVLDFGCGCGRILRPVLDRRPAHAYTAGCDVDDQAIAWLARAYGERAEVLVNEFSPPLPFGEARFDLVYSVSIFTHLSKPSHEKWLAEMARVTRPGGLALLSVHGEHAYRGAREDRQSGIARDLAGRLAERGPLDEEGFVFEPYERRGEARDLHGIEGDYGLTFQSHDQIRREWSSSFEVLEIRPRVVNNWQDLVVLRRR